MLIVQENVSGGGAIGFLPLANALSHLESAFSSKRSIQIYIITKKHLIKSQIQGTCSNKTSKGFAIFM